MVQLADKAQVCTQRSWTRSYGVGLLVAGLDEKGPHLYMNCSSGNYFEYQAFAIGARSQTAKTYLERKFEAFPECSRDELICHGVISVREALAEGKLNGSNCSVAVVGIGEAFNILDPKMVQKIIDSLDDKVDEPPADSCR